MSDPVKQMIDVTAATRIIAESTPKFAVCEIALEHSLGRVLAQAVVADRSHPPFNRVMMDGIAISKRAWQNSQSEFVVESMQRAGESAKILQDSNACVEVMTGAVLPQGTEVIIPYEDLQRVSVQSFRITNISDQKPWQYVHREGSDYQTNTRLLAADTRMGPAEIGVAAAVGCSRLRVIGSPQIAVVSTGDELVEVDQVPLKHQIRRSNAHALTGLMHLNGFTHTTIHHCRDEQADLYESLQKILLRSDVVVLSGGVSMGKFDLVPQVLADLGVRTLFHKVAQRPGKPLFFGLSEKNKVVIGVPGNPVSALVCARRYLIPALRQASGLTNSITQARLETEVTFKAPLTFFQPVRCQQHSAGERSVQPMLFNTSGDFAALAGSDGFVELPAEQEHFAGGEHFNYYPWQATC